MALIECKECGNQVSNTAKTCPKCGAKVARVPMGCGTLIGVIFLGVIIISAFSGIFYPSTGSAPSPSPASVPAPSIAAPSFPRPPGFQWLYNHTDDAMGKGAIYRAEVSSSNTVNFDFPYKGEQHATLMLRNSPRHGKDVILTIERGQFLCHSYEDCTVLARFDDEKATNYSAVGPADNSTTTIFIRNYVRFVEKMQKAKRVRIVTNIHQEGAPMFEFDVSDFDPSQLKPKK